MQLSQSWNGHSYSANQEAPQLCMRPEGSLSSSQDPAP